MGFGEYVFAKSRSIKGVEKVLNLLRDYADYKTENGEKCGFDLDDLNEAMEDVAANLDFDEKNMRSSGYTMISREDDPIVSLVEVWNESRTTGTFPVYAAHMGGKIISDDIVDIVMNEGMFMYRNDGVSGMTTIYTTKEDCVNIDPAAADCTYVRLQDFEERKENGQLVEGAQEFIDWRKKNRPAPEAAVKEPVDEIHHD